MAYLPIHCTCCNTEITSEFHRRGSTVCKECQCAIDNQNSGKERSKPMNPEIKVVDVGKLEIVQKAETVNRTKLVFVDYVKLSDLKACPELDLDKIANDIWEHWLTQEQFSLEMIRKIIGRMPSVDCARCREKTKKLMDRAREGIHAPMLSNPIKSRYKFRTDPGEIIDNMGVHDD